MALSPLARDRASIALLCLLVTLVGCGGGGDQRDLRIDTVAGGLFVGDGGAATDTFLDPVDVAVDADGDVFVVDDNEVAGRALVRRIDARSGTITTVGGPCDPAVPDDSTPTAPPRSGCATCSPSAPSRPATGPTSS